MLYFANEDGKIVVSSEYTHGAESRWDWESFECAETIAAMASEDNETLYIATDAGPWVSPRYDIILAPKVGDPVSYRFNGDSYPSGFITKISKSMKRIETDEGRVFYRRKQSGSWVYNQTWSMVHGHHNERNTEF